MQPLLFEPAPSKPRRASTQRRELERVSGSIADDVLAFFRRVGVGNTFHGDELCVWVSKRHRCSPSSPDRVLRELNRTGQLRYRLVSRSASLYAVEAIT